MAGVYKEVWTKEVVKGFELGLKDTFLDGVRDYSRYVTGDDESQVIHSTYFGVEPDVLINNSTYPIGIQDLNGSDIPIALDKYQTKATPITDDELYALSYDKLKEVKDLHVNAIIKNRLKKAAHALGPQSHAADHPVLLTTGSAINGRKKLTWNDVISLCRAYSEAGIEIEGFRFVLCPAHKYDLLEAEPAMFKQYADFQKGIITRQLGFEFREFANNPYYAVSSKTKKSFGAVPTAGDNQASVIFPVEKVSKATGVTKMYYSEAKTDPLNQRSLVNFRNYFIALPQVSAGFGAIVSDIFVEE